MPGGSRLDGVVGGGERGAEAGAAVVEIETDRVRDAEAARDLGGDRRAAVDRAARGDRDQADFAGFETGPGQRLGRGFDGEVGDRAVREAAGRDAGAAADPFVARVDHAFQVGVGQHAGGLVVAERGDAGTGHLSLLTGVAHYSDRSFVIYSGFP